MTPQAPAPTTAVCTTCRGSCVALLDTISGPPSSRPCPLCRGTGSITVVWQTSSRDQQSHLFLVDSAPAWAVCSHTVPVDLLTTDAAARACMACTLALAELAQLDLADRAQWA